MSHPQPDRALERTVLYIVCVFLKTHVVLLDLLSCQNARQVGLAVHDVQNLVVPDGEWVEQLPNTTQFEQATEVPHGTSTLSVFCEQYHDPVEA